MTMASRSDVRAEVTSRGQFLRINEQGSVLENGYKLYVFSVLKVGAR